MQLRHTGPPVTVTLRLNIPPGFRYWSGDVGGVWQGNVGGDTALTERLFREPEGSVPGAITLTLEEPVSAILTVTLPLDGVVTKRKEWEP